MIIDVLPLLLFVSPLFSLCTLTTREEEEEEDGGQHTPGKKIDVMPRLRMCIKERLDV